jgi:Ohr subfamily peroxiredoxin
MTILYTTEAVVEGGRSGHGRTVDGQLAVQLSVPKEMGGDGGPGTNPEELFAVGYAACFQSGLLSVARGRKLDASDSTITSQVGIGPTGHGGFSLTVSLDLHAPKVSRVDAEDLMRRAHAICPYSNATRGNIDVALRVDGTPIAETDSTEAKRETLKVIENYEAAIENGDENLLKEVFAPQVRFEIPTGESSNYAVETASHIMSQVAKVLPGIKNRLTADAGNDWHLLAFEGQIEGQKIQAVDQVHLDKDGRIDQLTVYMRPIPAAQKFLQAIGQRLQPATASS